MRNVRDGREGRNHTLVPRPFGHAELLPVRKLLNSPIVPIHNGYRVRGRLSNRLVDLLRALVDGVRPHHSRAGRGLGRVLDHLIDVRVLLLRSGFRALHPGLRRGLESCCDQGEAGGLRQGGGARSGAEEPRVGAAAGACHFPWRLGYCGWVGLPVFGVELGVMVGSGFG